MQASAISAKANSRLYEKVLVEEIAKKKIITVKHKVQGRLRLQVRGLYRSWHIKSLIQSKLASMPLIVRLEVNVLTASVLVVYESDAQPETIIGAIEKLLRKQLQMCLLDISMHPDKEESKKTWELLSAEEEDFGNKPWHTLAKAEALKLCHSDEQQGLSQELARLRLAQWGYNRLYSQDFEPSLKRFFKQFYNLPVGVLAASALVSLCTGAIGEAGLICAVLGINSVIGYVTESRSERAIRSLDSKETPLIPIIRDGKIFEISSDHLVFGDIIILRPGEVVADALVLSANGLRVDESALTGESRPVKKKEMTFSNEKGVALNDRCNMLYKGTVITAGSAKALVVATGGMTELGKIKRLSEQAYSPETVLQQNLRKLSDEMVWLSLSICGGVFAIGLLRGLGLGPMLKTAVSLAIAAVPEGLCAVGTTTLACGVKRLRQNNILARSLHGVEALGSVQVFCLDKTGTLTLNQMSVAKVILDGEEFDLPSISLHDARLQDVRKCAEIVCLCNDTKISANGLPLKLEGSATERALIEWGMDLGLDPLKILADNPKLQTFYRTETKQYMSTLHQGIGDAVWVALKGNPEQVLEQCQTKLFQGRVLPLTAEDRSKIMLQNRSLAHSSLRVLGVAFRERLAGELVWVGMLGLTDPLRSGIKELISDFHRAGIATIMLTGDQEATAKAIGLELGLSGKGELVVAPEQWLSQLCNGNGDFNSVGKNVHIYPRVSPSNKLQIVKAIQQEAGKIVAMTGDGVNDAPALKAANVGITLGQGGTSTAIECADIVVADDKLETIYYAIAQGRTIHRNLRQAIQYLLTTNLSEILLMFAGLTLGLGSPLTPMQLLWINLLTDIFPSLALAMERSDPYIMKEHPEDPSKPLFGKSEKLNILKESSLMTVGSLASFAFVFRRNQYGQSSATVAFAALTGSQLLHAFSTRLGAQSLFQRKTRETNPYLRLAVMSGLASVAGAIYIPGLNRLLGNRALPLKEACLATAGACLPFLANEGSKWLRASWTKIVST